MAFWKNLDAWADVETKAAYAPGVVTVGGGKVEAVKDFGDGKVAISEGYKRCSWVWRCVRRKQEMIGSLRRWKVREYDDKGNWKDRYDHPAARVIMHPVHNRWPYLYSMYRGAGFLSVAGNVFYGLYGSGVSKGKFDPEKFRKAAGREMRVESPIGVTPIQNGDGWIKEYELVPPRKLPGGREIKAWDPATVIHAMIPNLTDDGLWGQSELQGIGLAIDTDISAKQWNRDGFATGGMPTTIIVDPTLTKENLEQRRDQFTDGFRGKGKDRTPMLVPGVALPNAALQLIRLGMTAQDLDFLQGSEMSRDEIVSNLGFHPSDFDPKYSTLDNAKVAKRTAWEQGALPLVGVLAAWMGEKLLTHDELEAGSVLLPDLREVGELFSSQGELAEAFSKYTGPGRLSVRDAASNTGVQISDQPEYDHPAPPAQQARGDARSPEPDEPIED